MKARRGAPRSVLWLLGPLMLLMFLAASGGLQGAEHDGEVDPVSVNVVSARDISCSDDEGDTKHSKEADLRVTVFLNDDVWVRTPKAQDQNNPEYGTFAERTVYHFPADIRIRVEEAEPGGFFGSGTRWVTCDTSQSEGDEVEFTWEGEHEVVSEQGSSENATWVNVVFGPDAPPQPELRLVEQGTHEVTLGWDQDADRPVDSHRLRWGEIGPFIAESGGDANRFHVQGLCDYSRYGMSLLRDTLPWHIQSPEFRFNTANAPPEGLKVLKATREEENVTVEWKLGSYHDIDRFEVQVGHGETLPLKNVSQLGSSDPDGIFQPYKETFADVPQNATYVVVEAFDEGGLSANSTPHLIDGPSKDMDESFRPQKEPCDRSYGLSKEDPDELQATGDVEEEPEEENEEAPGGDGADAEGDYEGDHGTTEGEDESEDGSEGGSADDGAQAEEDDEEEQVDPGTENDETNEDDREAEEEGQTEGESEPDTSPGQADEEPLSPASHGADDTSQEGASIEEESTENARVVEVHKRSFWIGLATGLTTLLAIAAILASVIALRRDSRQEGE